MLVVVASPRDTAAEALATRWAARGAALLTPADLSRPGWRFDPDAPGRGTAVIAGQRAPVRTIRGVLTRLPAVFAADLSHIVAEDRAYVAEEMTAFLLAWLSSLRCPVVNRPVPPSLAGPDWRPMQWVDAAVRAGFQVPRGGASDPDAHVDAQTIIVVAGRCLGEVGPSVATRAVRLAASAKISLVALRVQDFGAVPTFIEADPWLDPSDLGVADALLAQLEGVV